ncbi:RNA-binding domain-containing protein [Xylariaceae sp. FL1019]|nr:RNA-binding domain-containing protein [Xylariaceae sp. FL1019]
MPELRPRKASVAKAISATKAPSKRKAAANDDAQPTVTKKAKADVKPKKTHKKSSAVSEKENEPEVVEEVEDEASEDDQGPDQATALARIVDSDAEAEDDEDAASDVDAAALEVPEAPKEIVKSTKSDGSKPGVVYVGRIPRGFYEHQMREYFTQFGVVTKIRMSRNKITGQSKHFAFVEFADKDVAEIVAKTMDNYLLAGHILKVKMVPASSVHENLWVGANKRFKKVPWNKIAGNKLKKPLSESTWTTRISKEEKRREERAKKLKAIGYEFESPQLKTVDDVKTIDAPAEAPAEETPKAIEAAPEPTVDEDEPKEKDVVEKVPVAKASKKGKKAKKTK